MPCSRPLKGDLGMNQVDIYLISMILLSADTGQLSHVYTVVRFPSAWSWNGSSFANGFKLVRMASFSVKHCRQVRRVVFGKNSLINFRCVDSFGYICGSELSNDIPVCRHGDHCCLWV
jgi:hypothetical protein